MEEIKTDLHFWVNYPFKSKNKTIYMSTLQRHTYPFKNGS